MICSLNLTADAASHGGKRNAAQSLCFDRHFSCRVQIAHLRNSADVDFRHRWVGGVYAPGEEVGDCSKP
jgi:hypothetical protein